MRKAPIILYMIEKQVGEDAFKKVYRVDHIRSLLSSFLMLLIIFRS